MPSRRLAAFIAGAAVVTACLSGSVGASAAAVVVATPAAPAAPTADLQSGRHVGTQLVTLSSVAGTEIHYTLDGTMPTARSPRYTAPISISETSTLTAVAFDGATESTPLLRGYVIKTAEEPLAQFAVMSDIHLSSDSPDLVTKWQTYFDALQRIAPHPDAIISNGDQINDNNHDSAAAHRFPRAMLEQNLARTGMTDTKVLMSFGNHDDYVDRMAAQYPREWFPHTGAGYYETEIAGFPVFVVNTEAWNAAQSAWLTGRLKTLSTDPATQGLPVFVFGHRPVPNTVWDGAQSSNAGLRTVLAGFPQAVYFSGHSHLNIDDERSIHQDSFTSVNDGSMSYEETDTMFQSFGAGLAKEYTIASAQSVLVEVYADRVEIDRINYAAEDARTYTDEGKWSFQKNPPFASTGTIAGPTWVVDRGADPAEIKAGFTYTPANRNKTAPNWGDAPAPSVRAGEAGLVLQLPQASDDHYVKSYSLALTDPTTGRTVEFVPANDRINAQYTQAPRPAVLNIPLALRAGNRVGGAIDRTLTYGTAYEATLVAYDSYGNASERRTFRFVAGELDRVALDAALAEAAEVAGTVERVLGAPAGAHDDDFSIHIADPDAARAAVAALQQAVSAAPAAAIADPASGLSQDDVDAASADIAERIVQVRAQLATVDRTALRIAVDEAASVIPTIRGKAWWKQDLAESFATADRLRRTLNVSQEELDDAAGALRAAHDVYAKKIGR